MEFRKLNKIYRILLNYLSDKSITRILPVQWSYMHLFSSTQLVKIIALKRKLDIELSAICMAFHDIATIVKGIRKDHAAVGSRIVPEIIAEYNEKFGPETGMISEKMESIIISTVKHHSEKHIQTDNPYDELIKDVDTYDRHLHGLETNQECLFRIERIEQEMNLTGAE